jgi:hypothetical protein
MEPPDGVTRAACPCNAYVLEIAGPELAWALAEKFVQAHGETCPRAAEPWTHAEARERAE